MTLEKIIPKSEEINKVQRALLKQKAFEKTGDKMVQLNPDFIKSMKDPNKNFAKLFKVFVEEKDTRKKKRKQNTNVNTICQLRFALQI